MQRRDVLRLLATGTVLQLAPRQAVCRLAGSPCFGSPGLTIHEVGTARMGRDPRTSVLNAHNQAHDIKNLVITDGGAMVSSSCVNPSLTYMGHTARACDYAVQ